MKTKTQKYQRCHIKECTNTFDHAVGGDRVLTSGPYCLPCFYAAQLVQNGLTPEQIEERADYMEMMIPHLASAGWLWSDVKTSYQRKPVLD